MADLAMTAASPAAPVLLDVTRLVARSWAGRQPTGIDRVCDAYLRHFRPRARAVVQHRGVIRVLPVRESEDLFHLLDAPPRGRRAGLARLLSSALLAGSGRPAVAGQAYLNAGDTDFDLPAHHRWASESGVRSFYVIHDLIPTRHPEFSRPHAVLRHRGRVRGALVHGAGLIMGTQAVRKELEAYALAENLRLPPLLVAPFAGTDLTGHPRAETGKEEPFFLCVGTIEPRKNHRLLFALWERLAARLGAATPKLVLVGQSGPMTGDLLAPLGTLRPHVEHRRVCSDDELADLMCRARALLMPSLAEGFGLPVVEALQSGTPVIASTLPVFDEIGQGAARLVDPCDIVGWEEAIIAATLLDRSTAGPAPGFVPPHWPDHFEAVERFIASRVPYTRSSSQRVLAA
jgi:glycosyltransferase involved in cell wall biosynthesis